MTRTTLGVAIGLALGLALAFGSFGKMLIVALFAVIGLVVANPPHSSGPSSVAAAFSNLRVMPLSP